MWQYVSVNALDQWDNVSGQCTDWDAPGTPAKLVFQGRWGCWKMKKQIGVLFNCVLNGDVGVDGIWLCLLLCYNWLVVVDRLMNSIATLWCWDVKPLLRHLEDQLWTPLEGKALTERTYQFFLSHTCFFSVFTGSCRRSTRGSKESDLSKTLIWLFFFSSGETLWPRAWPSESLLYSSDTCVVSHLFPRSLFCVSFLKSLHFHQDAQFTEITDGNIF